MNLATKYLMPFLANRLTACLMSICITFAALAAATASAQVPQPNNPAPTPDPVRTLDSVITKTANDINKALQQAFAPDSTQTTSIVQTMETLIMPDFTNSGLYAASFVRLSNVGGGVGAFLGGYGGWLFDKTLMIGAGGFGLANPNGKGIAESFPTGIVLDNMGYGGLVAEYTFTPAKVLHYSIQMFAGIGGASISDSRVMSMLDKYTTQTIFVLEPAAFIEMNFTKTVRASFGASYRWIVGEPFAAQRISSAQLSGVSLVFTLKLGKF